MSFQKPSFSLIEENVFTDHSSAITQCIINYNGEHVASTDISNDLYVWGINTKPSTGNRYWNSKHISPICWSPQNYLNVFHLNGSKGLEYILCPSLYFTVKEFQAQSDMKILSTSCSNATLACSAVKNIFPKSATIRLYDASTCQLKESFVLSDHPRLVADCSSFNSDGNLLFLGCSDGRVRSFDIRSNACVNSWAAHSNRVCSLQICCYNLANAAHPILNATIPNCGLIHGNPCFAIDSERNLLMTACGNPGPNIFKVDSGKLLFGMSLGGKRQVSPVTTCDWTFSNHYATILSGSTDGTIKKFYIHIS